LGSGLERFLQAQQHDTQAPNNNSHVVQPSPLGRAAAKDDERVRDGVVHRDVAVAALFCF
jgi:hypothetical protein